MCPAPASSICPALASSSVWDGRKRTHQMRNCDFFSYFGTFKTERRRSKGKEELRHMRRENTEKTFLYKQQQKQQRFNKNSSLFLHCGNNTNPSPPPQEIPYFIYTYTLCLKCDCRAPSAKNTSKSGGRPDKHRAEMQSSTRDFSCRSANGSL